MSHKPQKAHDDSARDGTFYSWYADVLRKELENEIKKNVALQKEVVQLRSRVKIIDGTKITEMHNEIKEKDKKIDEMNQTIKTYAKAATQ